MINFFNNTKRINNNIKKQGKLLFILFLVFCCFVFKAQSEVSTEKANAVEVQFKAGKFQMESMESPQFMNGKCYQEALIFFEKVDGKIVERVANHVIYGPQPNSATVLLYPYNGKILFYGAFGSLPEPPAYTREEIIGKFFGKEDVEAKLNNDLESGKRVDFVKEGEIALWDTSVFTPEENLDPQYQPESQPLFMTEETGPEQPRELVKFTSENRITQSLDDPNKIFLKRIFGRETSYCELEIMEI